MNIKKIFGIIFLVFISATISCEEKGRSSEMQTIIETVLRDQLKSGYSQSNDVTDVKYIEFDRQSIQTSNFFIYRALEKEGYSVSDDDFQDKIKSIFGDLKFKNNISLIDKTQKCQEQKNIELNNPEGFRTIFIIDSQHKIITELFAIPEIIDYKTEYPNIANEELTMPLNYKNIDGQTITVNKWKDCPNLLTSVKKNQKLMMNRNLYLFKNDFSKLDWLLQNDNDFLMRLVLDYGWLDDDKILSYTIQEVSTTDNYESFSKLFWNKDCEGNLRVNSKIYQFLEKQFKTKNLDKEVFLDKISAFFDYINTEDTTIFDNLSKTERTKVLCNLAYFAEQFKFKDEKSNHRIMGKLRYYLADDEDLLAKNDYFGLPKFKEWWNLADYDEYIVGGDYEGPWGEGNPPLSEDEWRIYK